METSWFRAEIYFYHVFQFSQMNFLKIDIIFFSLKKISKINHRISNMWEDFLAFLFEFKSKIFNVKFTFGFEVKNSNHVGSI